MRIYTNNNWQDCSSCETASLILRITVFRFPLANNLTACTKSSLLLKVDKRKCNFKYILWSRIH